MKKLWFADKFINRIVHRAKNKGDEQCERLSVPHGTFHATWEEAHAAIISRREAELRETQRAFDKARDALSRARRMQPPGKRT